jgi:hypothetical protein
VDRPQAILLAPLPIKVANARMCSRDACDDAVAASHINTVVDTIKAEISVNVISGDLSKKLKMVSALLI